MGWEPWLESGGTYDTWTVDKFISLCFYMLYLVYFTDSMFLATRKALEELGQIIGAILLGTYMAIDIWFLIFLFRNIRTSTQTNLDQEEINIGTRKKQK